jgi:hypothetical protein
MVGEVPLWNNTKVFPRSVLCNWYSISIHFFDCPTTAVGWDDYRTEQGVEDFLEIWCDVLEMTSSAI